MRTNLLRISILIFIALAFLASGVTPGYAQDLLSDSYRGQGKTTSELTFQTNASITQAENSTQIYLPSVIKGVSDVESKESVFPSLEEFSTSVRDEQNEVVRGVYVLDVLALRVVQQPEENLSYIDATKDTATQYQLATYYDTIGLLAHNFHAGALFSTLVIGQKVSIIYGDGAVEHYRVEAIKEFQAVDPDDPYSSFIDLETEESLSSFDVFRQVYMGEEHVTFQTCIANGGISTWGRLFVLAIPIP